MRGDYQVKQYFDRNEQMEQLNYVYYDQSSNFKIYICIDNKVVVLPNDDLIFKYWDYETGTWSD